MFSDSFLETLPSDGIEAIYRITVEFYEVIKKFGGKQEEYYDDFVKAYGIVQALCAVHGYRYNFDELNASNQKDNINIVKIAFGKINKSAEQRITQNTIKTTQEHYTTLFSRAFKYEFSNGDFDRIQSLINELRDEITKSTLFEEKHKKRLLARLEKLQSELHKKMGNVDMLWGFIGDAGVVLGKFGKDVKPLVDRIREILIITWRTQAAAEQLPSTAPFPMLSGKTEGENGEPTDPPDSG